MTKKKLLVRILSMVLVFGFVSIGCDDGSDDGSNENTEPKSIEITGMDTVGKSGFTVWLFSTMPPTEVEGEPVVEINGFGFSDKGEVTIELKEGDEVTGKPWTGTGSYYVYAIDSDDVSYLYMNSDTVRPDTTFSNVPKLKFSNTVTTVSLDKFASFGK